MRDKKGAKPFTPKPRAFPETPEPEAEPDGEEWERPFARHEYVEKEGVAGCAWKYKSSSGLRAKCSLRRGASAHVAAKEEWQRPFARHEYVEENGGVLGCGWVYQSTGGTRIRCSRSAQNAGHVAPKTRFEPTTGVEYHDFEPVQGSDSPPRCSKKIMAKEGPGFPFTCGGPMDRVYHKPAPAEPNDQLVVANLDPAGQVTASAGTHDAPGVFDVKAFDVKADITTSVTAVLNLPPAHVFLCMNVQCRIVSFRGYLVAPFNTCPVCTAVGTAQST